MLMTQLSTGDLEYMRSSIEELMPDICNILTATLASDGSGGMTATWGTIGASIPCRLDAIRGNENIQGARLAPQHAYVVTLAHDVDIDTDDRIEIGTHIFTVTSVDFEKSWDACTRVYLERT
jgi:head-tail adaptor